MSKKSTAHPDTTKQTPTPSVALPLANPPPAVGAPATPTGWKKSKWIKPREGLRPTATQADAVGPAAAELRTSATYVADFGANAPPAAGLAQDLSTASQWRDEWSKTRDWLAYCSEQRRLWEDASLAGVATLKPAYDYAVSRDPTVAKRYPSTNRLVGARSDVSARAAARRKANEKAAEEREPATPSPPGNTTAAAAPKNAALN